MQHTHKNLSRQKLIDTLTKNRLLLTNKTVTAGFDGFIDRIVKLIREKQKGKTPTYFTSIRQWGDYISSKQKTSFSLEMEDITVRAGGNMPILANALSEFDVQVNAIGTMGYPEIHPVFKSLSEKCKLCSFAEPGESTAVEFRDGKIFLANFGKMHESGWKQIAKILGKRNLTRLFSQTDIICLLNWSEIDASTDIWRGLLRDIISKQNVKERPSILVDLSDCSKRPAKEILEVLDIIGRLNKLTRVTFSMNRNEAGLILKVLRNKSSGDLKQQTRLIHESLPLTTIIIHSSQGSVAYDGAEIYSMSSFHNPRPVISTGAGDNFNAGLCIAQLMELDLPESLLLANAMAGYYVSNGRPGTLNDILRFLKNTK